MNCRHILKCYLGIAVALLFAPQPKVMASTFNGCNAEPNIMVADNAVTLEAVDIFGDDVEQIATQDQLLPTISPYKSSSYKEVIWRMRMPQSDYNSYLQSGQSMTYTLTQFQPSQLKVEAVPGSIRQYAECQGGSEPTVLIQGTAKLIFGELDKWTVGKYTPRINVCIPGIRGC
jgi:hypothetical protein